MKNIKQISPPSISVLFRNNQGEELLLIQHETEVLIITDGTEHEKEISGTIAFVNEDGIDIDNNNDIIFWEYIEEINIL